MTVFKVRQTKNHVEIEGSGVHATYDLAGIDLPPLNDFSFAVWHLLTRAMHSGEPIHIDGPVDPLVIRNAERLSRIWEMWQPKLLHEVRITANEEAPPQEANKRDVMFYSGGVDSTHMLLGLKDLADAVALTVKGFDYQVSNDAGFAALLALTDPVLAQLNRERITLCTNVGAISKGRFSWGLSLAGCAFFLSGLFSRGLAAADFTPEQDFIAFPWGSNHLSNRYFAGSFFRLETMFAELTRCEKVRALGANPLARSALSFCTKRNMRPKNCGRCSKCLRTKAMFAVVTGSVPDIFVDPVLDRAAINSFDLSSNVDRAYFIDLYQEARAMGVLDQYPELHRKFQREIAANGQSAWQTVFASFRARRRRH